MCKKAGHPGPSPKHTCGRLMVMQFKQWLISLFSPSCPEMHNRQSVPSHRGVSRNGQLLIIVSLSTQFTQLGTDSSAGDIIMQNNEMWPQSIMSGQKKRHLNWYKVCKQSISDDLNGTVVSFSDRIGGVMKEKE